MARVALGVVAVGVLAASCGGSGSLPRSAPTVDVDMSEYRFDYDATFGVGRTVVRVNNRGQLEHQLVLVFLEPGVAPIEAQLRSPERIVVPTVVSLGARPPGGTGTFAVDLDPGRYGFVCFVEDPDGAQHAVKGMSSEFRVE